MHSMLKRLTAILAAVLALSLLAACSGGDEAPDTASDATSEAPTDEPTNGGTDDPAAEGACEYVEDPQGAAKDAEMPPVDPAQQGEVQVTLSTSAGDIPATLDAEAAPCTVNSFVSLAEQGYFDETQCHRLTTQGIFVLQCGDPTASGMGGPGYTIPDELSGEETYPAGTLAMAKTPMPNSGGSQFFIVYEDTDLPPEYTVFGTIDADGLQVTKDIAAKGTESGEPDGAPKETVEITGVTVG